MPENGFDSILTVWTWPTIPWWLVAALLFGLVMVGGAVTNGIRREPKPAIITAALAVVSLAGGLLAYALLPNTDSATETTRIIAEGTIIESNPTGDDEPIVRLRLDTDPTWVLIFRGDDADRMAEAAGTVKAQCEWGTSEMECSSKLTGPQRPLLVPWWATTKEMHAVLLPAGKE